MVLEAVGSARQQNYGDMEIIVVDDGSTDGTAAALKSAFSEVKLIYLKGEGPGAARNAGVEISTGEVLMFLDSDDRWLDGHVTELLNVIDRGYEFAYGAARTVDEISNTEFLIPEDGAGMEGDCFEQLLRWCFLVPSASAVTRKAFSAAGGFDHCTFGEDWPFFLKVAAHRPLGFAGSEPITFRRLHNGSLCYLTDRKKLLAIIEQLVTVLKNEPRATAAHIKHFADLHDWTASNIEKFSTVQDWYLLMKKENMI
jgi:glycosyltransferase involved in cell wall biosynthesis